MSAFKTTVSINNTPKKESRGLSLFCCGKRQNTAEKIVTIDSKSHNPFESVKLTQSITGTKVGKSAGVPDDRSRSLYTLANSTVVKGSANAIPVRFTYNSPAKPLTVSSIGKKEAEINQNFERFANCKYRAEALAHIHKGDIVLNKNVITTIADRRNRFSSEITVNNGPILPHHKVPTPAFEPHSDLKKALASHLIGTNFSLNNNNKLPVNVISNTHFQDTTQTFTNYSNLNGEPVQIITTVTIRPASSHLRRSRQLNEPVSVHLSQNTPLKPVDPTNNDALNSTGIESSKKEIHSPANNQSLGNSVVRKLDYS